MKTKLTIEIEYAPEVTDPERLAVAQGAAVQRCDLCERYPTDEAAFAKLVERGIASPEQRQDPE